MTNEIRSVSEDFSALVAFVSSNATMYGQHMNIQIRAFVEGLGAQRTNDVLDSFVDGLVSSQITSRLECALADAALEVALVQMGAGMRLQIAGRTKEGGAHRTLVSRGDSDTGGQPFHGLIVHVIDSLWNVGQVVTIASRALLLSVTDS